MKNFLLLTTFIIITGINFLFAQPNIIQLRSKYNSLEKFWVATFEGGVTFPFTDFQTPAVGYIGRAGIEYYFPSRIFLTPGIKLHASYGELNGESDRGRLSGEGTFQRMIKKFNTPFVLIEPSIVFALGRGNFIPYVSGGFAYFIAFIPLEKGGYSLFNNTKRKPFITLSREFGFRYFIHKDFSYNISLEYYQGKIDEFDGYISRKKDSFYTITTGISMHLFRKERIR